MPCCATEPSSHRPRRFKAASLDRRPHPAPARSDARGREQTTARIVLQRLTSSRLRFQPSRPAPSLPHQVPNEHAENAGTRKRRHPEEASALDSLENAGTRKRRHPEEASALDSLENAGTRKRRHPEEASALDSLENTIRRDGTSRAVGAFDTVRPEENVPLVQNQTASCQA